MDSKKLALSLALASASLLPVVLVPSGAYAQAKRYGTTQPGNVIAAGNTLGLSNQTGVNGPGETDSIGTFTTLDTTSVDNVPLAPGNPWFAGTTSEWEENGSTARINLPAEAEILYAELVWGGSFQYGDENVLGDLGTGVTLSSDGDSITVMPDDDTDVTVSEFGTFAIRYYMRSGDVTSFVAAHRDGDYSVEGVPGTQSILANTTNAAGWTLILAYRFDGEPIRNMSVFVGGRFVDEDTTVDYPVAGFCAPPSEPIEGTIAIATIEGDADRQGDQLAIGETAADPTFVNLSGPNNPVNNFFCSQINGPDGLLDTDGTFGTRNHPLGDTIAGGRQGWDVTNVTLSSDDGHLVPNQTSAVLRTQTLSDSYMPVLAGIAIEVNAPKFLYDSSTTEVDKDSVTVGDQFTFTAKIVNEGSAPANDVAFTLAVPAGVTLVDFTTNGADGDVDGNAVTQGMLTSGVPMGDVTPNETMTVAATFEITQSLSSDIVLRPIWTYEYRVCINDPVTDEEFKGAVVTVEFDEVVSEGGGGQGGEGGAGAAGGNGGAGAAGGNGGAGGGTDDGGITVPEGGGFFRCSAPAGNPGPEGGIALVLAAAGFAFARRRRS